MSSIQNVIIEPPHDHNQQKWLCAQRRLRSAWASAQSDQSLCCLHEETLGPLITYWAHSEDSDQTGWMPRLIWVFAGHICNFVAFVMRCLNYVLVILQTLKKKKKNTCIFSFKSWQTNMKTLRNLSRRCYTLKYHITDIKYTYITIKRPSSFIDFHIWTEWLFITTSKKNKLMDGTIYRKEKPRYDDTVA